MIANTEDMQSTKIKMLVRSTGTCIIRTNPKQLKFE